MWNNSWMHNSNNSALEYKLWVCMQAINFVSKCKTKWNERERERETKKREEEEEDSCIKTNLTSTPRVLQLSLCLSWCGPAFGHLPRLMRFHFHDFRSNGHQSVSWITIKRQRDQRMSAFIFSQQWRTRNGEMEREREDTSCGVHHIMSMWELNEEERRRRRRRRREWVEWNK